MCSCWRRAASSRRAARRKWWPIRSWSKPTWVTVQRRGSGAAMSTEAMSSVPLLDIRALCAGYGDTDVLRGVDLKVETGEIVAVLGSNGVGKSTLNRTISGVVRARGGGILFEGTAIERETPAAIVARGLIHVPESLGPRQSRSRQLPPRPGAPGRQSRACLRHFSAPARAARSSRRHTL